MFRSGMAGIGEAVVAGAAGLGLAALVTPWMVHHVGRSRTVQAALLISTVAQLALAALLAMPTVLVVAFVLGATGQIIKLCTDTAVQSEIDDDVLGRVFALYDIVFNVGLRDSRWPRPRCSARPTAAPLDCWPAPRCCTWLGLVAHDLELAPRRRPAVTSPAAARSHTAPQAPCQRQFGATLRSGGGWWVGRAAAGGEDGAGRARLTVGGGPGAELGFGLGPGQRAAFHAQRQQVLLGPGRPAARAAARAAA